MSLPLASIRAIRDRLIEAYPELAEDNTALTDMLDGETGAIDFIAALIRQSKEDEASVKGLKALIDDYQARAERLKQRATAKKEAAFNVMQELGLRKVERPEFTASVSRRSPKVIITDRTLIPDDFWTVIRKENTTDIGKALKAGEHVPGATLSNAEESLTVRIR